MTRKTKDTPRPVEETESQVADRIKDSARQIWLAGLGAYTKAEEDTGRFFERLVREGEEIESRTRGVVERQVRAVEDRVGTVKSRATESWDRLENVFDQRVSRALGRLGIPSRRELRALEERVQELEEALEKKKRPAARSRASGSSGRSSRSPSASAGKTTSSGKSSGGTSGKSSGTTTGKDPDQSR